MNIRAAIKEKNILDKRIEKLAGEIEFLVVYQKDDPIIGLKTPEDSAKKIESNWQALNDMIVRREAINRTILDANMTNKVKVPRYVDFINVAVSEETEEISLANAINRKNYYSAFLKSKIERLARVLSNESKQAADFKKSVAKQILEQVDRRFAGLTNYSQTNKAQVQEDLEKKYEVVVLNPLGAEDRLPKIAEVIENYIQTIDNKLSSATETTLLTITY